MKKIKIIIATHKKYQMPIDKLYLPIHVGAYKKKSIGFKRDDEGENISKLNPFFCELTALYWGWKNLDANYIGLVHYRRYFKGKSKKENGKFRKILSSEEINKILDNCDVILPRKRNYYIETLYSHYEHTMYIEPLDITRTIIEKKYPKYLKEFDKLKIRRSAHMFNMLIMKKEILDDYCNWLFSILFELEKKCCNLKYDDFHSRFYGRVSELLLDVYINTNNIIYKEVKVISMEKVNWIKKGYSFLKAKFMGKKYEKSF